MMAMSQKAGAMAAQVRKGTIHAVLCQNLFTDPQPLNPNPPVVTFFVPIKMIFANFPKPFTPKPSC